MRSLQYLNERSGVPVTFIDNRDADIIFSPAYPKDRNFIEDTQTFRVYVATNIVEIIQPQFVNLRYKITLNTSNASINFSTVPSGVSITNVGTSWTVTGIDTIADWNLVKSPVITVDEDYFGDVGYQVTFTYNTSTQLNVTKSYNVGVIVPAVFLESPFVMTTAPNITKRTDIYLSSAATLQADVELVIRSTFNINLESEVTYSGQSNLPFNSNIECLGIKYSSFEDRTTITSNTNPYSGFAIDRFNDRLIVNDDQDSGKFATIYNLPSASVYDTLSSAFAGYQDIYDIAYTQMASNGTEYIIFLSEDEGDTVGRVAYKNNGDTSWTLDSAINISSDSATLGISNTHFAYGTNTGANQEEVEILPLESPYDGNGLALYENLFYNFGINLLDINNDYVVFTNDSSTSITIYNFNTDTETTFDAEITITSIDLYNNVIAISSTNTTKVYDISSNTVIETYNQGTSSSAEGKRSMVSLSDECVAIATPDENISGTHYGVIRLYERATGNLYKTINNPSTSGEDKFGSSISLTTDYLVVTAPYEASNTGRIYIYE